MPCEPVPHTLEDRPQVQPSWARIFSQLPIGLDYSFPSPDCTRRPRTRRNTVQTAPLWLTILLRGTAFASPQAVNQGNNLETVMDAVQDAKRFVGAGEFANALKALEREA